MKISVLYGGRLFFSLGNLFFPIYYYIFVIVNYGKDIRLRRIGLGNSSNLMKYRDKLFSPIRPLYQTKILTSLFLATPLSCNMMFLLFRKRCISNIYPVIILV